MKISTVQNLIMNYHGVKMVKKITDKTVLY